jgi:hypothetical protein
MCVQTPERTPAPIDSDPRIVIAVIEMHQDGEALDSHEDDRVAIRGGPSLGELLFGPLAMSIAALVLGLVDMMTVHLATVIADVHEISFKRGSILRAYRIDGAIQLGVGVLALILAGVAVWRLKRVVWVDVSEDDDALLAQIDEQSRVDPWTKALVGAALLVSIVAVVLSATAFGYAMAADIPPSRGIGF